jgi:D-alanine--poly(phosphoribitol) ligase subunit 1
MNLLSCIDRWGQEIADRIAHASGEHKLTYGDLITRSTSLAAYLTQTLPDDRSPVAVLGHKQPHMLIGFLGAVRAGHPYVPIDSTVPPQRVERIVASAGAHLVLTPERIDAILTGPIAVPQKAARPLGAEDAFYIIFTSGSTGEPKGVVITEGCLDSFLTWMLTQHRFVEGEEVFLNRAPFTFDVSVMDAYLSMLTGGTLFSITNDQLTNPKELYRALAGSGATVWSSTPSFVEMCLIERTFAAGMLPRLRMFILAGETLPPETARVLLDRFPAAEVWNAYGPTEATILATSARVDREMLAHYPSVPIGYPKPDSRLVIFGPDGRPVVEGERGEIILAGPNVSIGYIGRPDLTAAAFFEVDGLRAYHTGDWGRYRDGLVFYEGRMDSQIKLHGHRIELGDVEANLEALPGVRAAVVLPVLKGGRPEALAAFVIVDERPAGSDREFTHAYKAQLGARVPAYMVPRKFYFVDAFPIGASGKVDRRKLAEMVA